MTGHEVVNNAVNALKGSPVLLVVVLLNVVFLLAGVLYLRSEQRQMDRMIELIASCNDRTK
jgi:hypothetical protein